MSLCYYCGREEETSRCPHCGISFCKEHVDPDSHKCLAFMEAGGGNSDQREVIAEVAQWAPEKQQHNRVLIAVAMIMISLSSSLMVAISAGGAQGLPAAAPMEVDYELHSVAFSQVNAYRYRNDLPELEYQVSDLAQDWAFKLARSGEFRHNPDLPVSMGENIARRSEKGLDPKVALALMVQEMVTSDKQFGFANRDNILGDYDELSIGVAVDGDTVILVLNFG
jgi:hypothetical protein